MTIWERLQTALEGLGIPAAANVLIAATGSERPDSYLVYFLIADPGAQYADNDELAREHHVQVSYYTRGSLAEMPDVEGALKTSGFTRGPRRELPYNELTRHYGLAMDFYYLEEE